jgi:multiple sugar transport system ATP-binding protein
MASVELSGLHKSYGAVEVIKGVDLTIRDGEFVVLVGPSGCGKSTLLRMIAGLESITAGTIAIDGQVVNGLEPRERNIAMVFQSYALYPHMDIRDNMAFSLKLRKVPEPEIEEKVGEAARALGLSALLDRRPRQLSGGQRQRVAMGRAIVRSPSVFLFDEPLSNLDARLRVQTRVEIRELHERLSATSIFVTHDQVEAMTLADRIVLLEAGTIQQVGSPRELYNAPANTFVAGFIGSPQMNFWAGEAVSDGGRARFIPEEQAGAAIPLDGTGARPGARIVVGCRPEHMDLIRPDSEDAAFSGEVLAVEHLGPETHVYVRVGDQRICASTRDPVTLRAHVLVGLRPRTDRLHVFDAETGARLPS